MEKSWKFSILFVKTKAKTKTKTLLFVLEAPRDQDFGLEDYITVTTSISYRKTDNDQLGLKTRVSV